MADRYASEAIEPIGAISRPRKTKEATALEMIEGMPLSLQQPILSHPIDVLKPSVQIPASPIASDRPKLRPPTHPLSQSLTQYAYLDLMNQIKTRTNSITKSIGGRIDAHKKKIEIISEEQLHKMKENFDKVASNHWWSVFEKALTSVFAAVSLALGLATIAGGGSMIVGGALIFSGLGPIASFICSETGVWDTVAKQLANGDEEKRQRIALAIPTAIGITCAAIGLLSGGMDPQYIVGNAFAIFYAVLCVFRAVGTAGQGISQANLIHSQGELAVTNAALNEERTYLQAITQWIEHFMNDMRTISQQVKQMTEMVVKENQLVVQLQA